MTEKKAPAVDASPTEVPVLQGPSGPEAYVFAPADASPKEVLELRPNTVTTEGPHPQISPTMYVHMTRTDGSDFLAPLSNVDYYKAKGFTAGAEEDIPDLVAYLAERAQK